jgi:hypothetical protein
VSLELAKKPGFFEREQRSITFVAETRFCMAIQGDIQIPGQTRFSSTLPKGKAGFHEIAHKGEEAGLKESVCHGFTTLSLDQESFATIKSPFSHIAVEYFMNCSF